MPKFPKFFALILLIAAPAVGAQQVEESVTQLPVYEISINPDGIVGPGADILKKEMANSQFIAIGEDHGFADSAELTKAVALEFRSFGPIHHAVEIGPHSADLVKSALNKDGIAAMTELLTGKPLALPFLSNKEDAELAASFADENGDVSLWGIDQEFIGSPQLLLEQLKMMTGSDDARSLADRLIKRDQEALKTGNQGGLLMTSGTPEEFDVLRDAFSDSPEAQKIIESMHQSATIYQHNNGRRFFTNNYDRNALMRAQFLENYHAAEEKTPRVVLKMGAFHVGRGTTPTKMFDIGSMLPGLAAANKMQSLHIAFSGLSGDQLTIQPSPEGFTKVKPVEDKIITPILEAAGFDLSRIGDSGHYLIPVAPIRRKLESKGIDGLSTFAKFVVLGFDYIVTTRDVKAATPLVD